MGVTGEGVGEWNETAQLCRWRDGSCFARQYFGMARVWALTSRLEILNSNFGSSGGSGAQGSLRTPAAQAAQAAYPHPETAELEAGIDWAFAQIDRQLKPKLITIINQPKKKELQSRLIDTKAVK